MKAPIRFALAALLTGASVTQAQAPLPMPSVGPISAALVSTLGRVSQNMPAAGELMPADKFGFKVQSLQHVLEGYKVASEIADAGSNIDSITMDEDRSLYTTMLFVLEVANRQHLARVMRSLRRLPDVVKLARVRE